MKNISDLEQMFKNKTNTLLILDYNGTITQIEPKTNSPLSSVRFKRVLENLSRKSYLQIAIITDRLIKDFKREFGIDLKEISLFGLENGEFIDENGQQFAKKEDILTGIIEKNNLFTPVYFGDDKVLIKKVKELNGKAIGITPLCETGEKLVDFSISQNRFEEALLTINNLYL